MPDNDFVTVQLYGNANELTLTSGNDVHANITGFDPSELLAGSLAKCTESSVKRAAVRAGADLKKLEVKVNYQRDKEQRVSSLEVHLDLEGDLSDQQVKKLHKASEKSYIRRVLGGELNLSSKVHLNGEEKVSSISTQV